METTRPILVIGGGPAGTFAALAAQKAEPGRRASSCSPTNPASRTRSRRSRKRVLLGKVLPADAPIAGPAASPRTASCSSATRAVRRSIARPRTLVLEDGRRLPYGTLVIATGSLVRELPHLPVGMPHVHYLRTEADAHAIDGETSRARAGCSSSAPA